ncbi:MAG TPA: hypothetical protein VIV59_03930, partial [Anaeromyxobacteraceae bacterium]
MTRVEPSERGSGPGPGLEALLAALGRAATAAEVADLRRRGDAAVEALLLADSARAAGEASAALTDASLRRLLDLALAQLGAPPG